MSAANENTASIAYTAADRLVQDFAYRGMVALAPEDLGIPLEVHARVHAREKEAVAAQRRVTPGLIEDVLTVINAPGVVAACNRIVGEHWAIVPFTHNATFASSGRDQHWHKDDNGPFNGRKQRHHQAVQIEMLYYPQEVKADMGPTATIPYSHYWALNHEENHDNFAGADHLDFNYQLEGMEGVQINGPDSPYDPEDIVNQTTQHDIRMREAVTNTGWPLVQQFEAGPLKAGSVVLYSHNTYHRGNHRRDDWRTWQDNPRFMWRFWIYRTTDGAGDAPGEVDWGGVDPLTGVDLNGAGDDVTTVWRYHHHWMQTGQAPPPRKVAADERATEAERLFAQLHEKGEDREPQRIGAAYKLASLGDTALAVEQLRKALYTDRESVRRAATYGLIAVGEEATEVFLEAARSPIKWVRKAGVYGLGDASPLTAEVLEAVKTRLEEDSSVYVRAVAAGTLGCLGRRAVATGVGVELVPTCLETLMESLEREENRPAMDRAQGRSIKFVRPTDECDVCEGGGVDYGIERFAAVRSAVRENALWSAVILCSHGSAVLGDVLAPAIARLKKVVRTDQNVINVGFAMDALGRLAYLHPEGQEAPDTPGAPSVGYLRDGLLELLGEVPVQCWEALVRGGVPASAAAEFDHAV